MEFLNVVFRRVPSDGAGSAACPPAKAPACPLVHAAWPDRTARVLLPTLTALLFLAGVGVGVAGRRRQMRCVATMEWLAIGLFLSAALCSCAGRPACRLGRKPTGA